MKGAYKFAMLILNVVSAALCVIGIAVIFSGPLIQKKATVTINQTVVDLIFGKDDGNGKTELSVKERGFFLIAGVFHNILRRKTVLLLNTVGLFRLATGDCVLVVGKSCLAFLG